VLRVAQELLAADVSPRRVHAALIRLQDILPADRPLSAVQLIALGGRVLVREGDRCWDPGTGQLEMGLSMTGHDEAVEPSVHSLDQAVGLDAAHADRTRVRDSAEAWFDRGVELEGSNEIQARAAYRRALDLDPGFADAYVNLGRLLHEAGDLDEAELQYRAALAAEPLHARARFDLGVLLEGRGPGA
jgi:tetratricopeptide (TPR) repeat protein